MELKTVRMEIPEGCNVILGRAHFIKTVEDLYEVMVTTSPQVKFGIAFCESSGPCLVRFESNDEALREAAVRNALNLSCGHAFVILMKNAYPINFLNAIKGVQEVCTVYCATANPVEVIVAETEQGRAILGVVDGFASKGVESASDKLERKQLLRKFGYKL